MSKTVGLIMGIKVQPPSIIPSGSRVVPFLFEQMQKIFRIKPRSKFLHLSPTLCFLGS